MSDFLFTFDELTNDTLLSEVELGKNDYSFIEMIKKNINFVSYCQYISNQTNLLNDTPSNNTRSRANNVK